MALDLVEHVDARAHGARALEQAHAGADRVRREGESDWRTLVDHRLEVAQYHSAQVRQSLIWFTAMLGAALFVPTALPQRTGGMSPDHPIVAASSTIRSCSPAQYSVRAYPAGGGLSHSAEVFLLTHHGRRCSLRGYPSLLLLDGQGSPLATRASKRQERITGNAVDSRLVDLSGAQRASFEVDYTTEPGMVGPANRTCETISWMRVAFGRAHVDVPVEISPCGQAFSVTPISRGVLAPVRSG